MRLGTYAKLRADPSDGADSHSGVSLRVYISVSELWEFVCLGRLPSDSHFCPTAVSHTNSNV